MLIVVIVVDVLIFLLMAGSAGAFEFSARMLLDWGGNLGVLSLHGQFWRLFSAQFLHAGFQHILGNMVLLAITGLVVEAKLGPARALLAYLACGLAGNLLSAAIDPEVVSVGASGAIAGLLAIMVVLWASGRAPEVRGAWIAQTLAINALYSFAPNVDWAAHAGGFAAGLLAGIAMVVTGAAGEEQA